MKNALAVFSIVLISLGAAAETNSAQLIKQLNIELPPGTYQGKGYKHQCQVQVSSDLRNTYQVVVQLRRDTGRVIEGEFLISSSSRKHPDFETPNYVGSDEESVRTFVAVATNDAREGHRLVITEKGSSWAIKAGALRGVDVTCIIQK
jgi:hypothetical protein